MNINDSAPIGSMFAYGFAALGRTYGLSPQETDAVWQVLANERFTTGAVDTIAAFERAASSLGLELK